MNHFDRFDSLIFLILTIDSIFSADEHCAIPSREFSQKRILKRRVDAFFADEAIENSVSLSRAKSNEKEEITPAQGECSSFSSRKDALGFEHASHFCRKGLDWIGISDLTTVILYACPKIPCPQSKFNKQSTNRCRSAQDALRDSKQNAETILIGRFENPFDSQLAQ